MGEAYEAPGLGADLVAAVAGDEPPVAALRREAAQLPGVVAPFLGAAQRRRRDVGGQDAAVHAFALQERDGEAPGLLAVGAAGAPDDAGRQPRQHVLDQGFELALVAEEPALLDGDPVHEPLEGVVVAGQGGKVRSDRLAGVGGGILEAAG